MTIVYNTIKTKPGQFSYLKPIENLSLTKSQKIYYIYKWHLKQNQIRPLILIEKSIRLNFSLIILLIYFS